jgi:HEPN domain-containing protein
MKKKSDLVRSWLRKAGSDITAADATLRAGALDAACFHAQQAAEKYLKAFLNNAGVRFPFTHNLTKLVEICAGVDSSFATIAPTVEPLTPYAVELRYDEEFWPDKETAEAARTSALTVKNFVLSRLPADIIKGIE